MIPKGHKFGGVEGKIHENFVPQEIALLNADTNPNSDPSPHPPTHTHTHTHKHTHTYKGAGRF